MPYKKGVSHSKKYVCMVILFIIQKFYFLKRQHKTQDVCVFVVKAANTAS